jgi:hypothetical protein
MKIENFFLRYAYPCAYIIMQRGEISPKELRELEKTAIGNGEISRDRLENVFHRAFVFIDKLAQMRGKDRWDAEVIKEYFLSYHNEVIDKGEGIYGSAPEMLKELSRVAEGLIKDKKGDVLVIDYGRKRRDVLNHFVPQAKVGDKVRIHYGYAVEVVA